MFKTYTTSTLSALVNINLAQNVKNSLILVASRDVCDCFELVCSNYALKLFFEDVFDDRLGNPSCQLHIKIV